MPKSASELPNNQVNPDPTLEKRTRRKFSADYKLRIITEADGCKHGELGTLLRRENLYSNQLAEWRGEYAEHEFEGLQKSLPGPATAKTPEQRQIAQLNKEKEVLTHQLEIANDCLELQKKALSMLDHMRNGSNV
jgi:transposase